MHRTSTLLSTMQREWPILLRLSLIRSTTPPAWVIASTHDLCSRLSPAERAQCQADCPELMARLSGLRCQWRGTLVLAALLAMAVIAHTFEVPLDVQRMVIFAVTLYAILLPALLIHVGISYDYIAASALLQALRSTAAETLEQRAHAGLMPNKAFLITPAPSIPPESQYVEPEGERPD